MRAVGRAIKAARVEAGLTQEKLAERSEIAPRVLQKIEAGRITILVTTLIRIRRALGCDFDDLLPR
jgi:transcriptional regulator with XRE-family HTH domain